LDCCLSAKSLICKAIIGNFIVLGKSTKLLFERFVKISQSLRLLRALLLWRPYLEDLDLKLEAVYNIICSQFRSQLHLINLFL
jgi:hypothetical protein